MDEREYHRRHAGVRRYELRPPLADERAVRFVAAAQRNMRRAELAAAAWQSVAASQWPGFVRCAGVLEDALLLEVSHPAVAQAVRQQSAALVRAIRMTAPFIQRLLIAGPGKLGSAGRSQPAMPPGDRAGLRRRARKES